MRQISMLPLYTVTQKLFRVLVISFASFIILSQVFLCIYVYASFSFFFRFNRGLPDREHVSIRSFSFILSNILHNKYSLPSHVVISYYIIGRVFFNRIYDGSRLGTDKSPSCSDSIEYFSVKRTRTCIE